MSPRALTPFGRSVAGLIAAGCLAAYGLGACANALPPESVPGETPAPGVVTVITSRDDAAAVAAGGAGPAVSASAASEATPAPAVPSSAAPAASSAGPGRTVAPTAASASPR